jgi:hypothetical protein
MHAQCALNPSLSLSPNFQTSKLSKSKLSKIPKFQNLPCIRQLVTGGDGGPSSASLMFWRVRGRSLIAAPPLEDTPDFEPLDVRDRAADEV